jgi:nitrile hydratase
MDGVHDLGGRAGFGPVRAEPSEPVFHESWEGRTFGIVASLSVGGHTNTPRFRHAIERMDPVHYLGSSYYEHWLTAAATLAVELDLVSGDALDAAAGPFPIARPVEPDLRAQPPPAEDLQPFAVGDRVRVRNVQFQGHTRCPGYVRGHLGTVVRRNADEPVPELEAHAGQRLLEPCYAVRFDAVELWADDAEAVSTVTVDLVHRYLEAP